jgi:hypothetical protein
VVHDLPPRQSALQLAEEFAGLGFDDDFDLQRAELTGVVVCLAFLWRGFGSHAKPARKQRWAVGDRRRSKRHQEAAAPN